MHLLRSKYAITLTALLTLAVWVFCLPTLAQAPADTSKKGIAGLKGSGNGMIVTPPNDTTPKAPAGDSLSISVSKNALKSKVKYTAVDSIRFDVPNQKIYLYGLADVTYDDIELKADYIEIDWEKNVISAYGIPDSTGKLQNRPEFSQNGTSFVSDTMRYNFKTKKGKISKVITQEGQGYILAQVAKKDANDNVFIKNGQYTTCNNEHPHFSIRATKLKIVKDDKIVTGPANLNIEGIPTPLAIPFGFFPNKKGRSSGIVVPTYGNSPVQGYFLRDGGYYFGINDKIDLTLLGDIYSLGSYGVKANSNYVKRYKYNGAIDIGFAKNVFGNRFLKEIPNGGYSASNQFFIRWRHTQNTKARPGTNFSANVNAGTANYNSFNSQNTQLILTNTFLSSIAYSLTKSWYSLSLNMGHNQNTQTNAISFTLPEGQFNINRFFPFQRKVQVGTKKWYENIGVNANVNFRNQLNTIDSLLFTNSSLRKLQNGVQATVVANTQFKLLKYFTFSPSITYTNRTYFSTVNKYWDNNLQQLVTDTLFFWQNINNIRNRSEFNVQGTFTTRVYSTFTFKKGKISAIRHVLTPQVALNYRPDFSTLQYGFYGPNGTAGTYSPYEIGIYGQPSVGRQGAVGIALGNNLEAKVRDRKDTTGIGTKKIVLIEQLNIGTSYNLAADTLNWAFINISGRTTLFKNLGINFNSTFDPYTTKNNVRINKSQWSENKQLLRLNGATLALNWAIRPKEKPARKPQNKDEEDVLKMQKQHPDMFVDFNIPYNLNVSYNLNYNPAAAGTELNPKITQTLNFSGDVRLTPKTKIGFSSGYDFINKQMAFTSLDIYRDLHCWELSANWIPFGFRRSYNINIRVKASVLQDLKLTRRRSWQDFQ